MQFGEVVLTDTYVFKISKDDVRAIARQNSDIGKMMFNADLNSLADRLIAALDSGVSEEKIRASIIMGLLGSMATSGVHNDGTE